MKKIFLVIVSFALLISCGQKTTEQMATSSDSTKISLPKKASKSVDIFLDSNFTFLNLDSINEEMLRDSSVKRGYKYIKSVKRFKKVHCVYFRTGCSNTFFDENVFLVSKQNKINDITPVVIHDSKDFNYYHSDLYTLDKNYNKVDSLRVSLYGSDMVGDEPPYSKNIKRSKFDKEFIITTELEYAIYKDSTVTIDSTIFYRKIQKDGRIILIKKEKII